MAWKKANRELIGLLEEAAGQFPCQRRMMFGSPTFFINGNMFSGVHEDNIIIRLSEGDRAELADLYDETAPFEPMAGRPMKEYMTLPESLTGRPEILREWLERSYRYAAALPPKEPGRSGKKA